jgi:hypothetical protein
MRLALVALLLLVARRAPAKVFLTVDEALELVFPECEIERRTIYLSAAQLGRAGELAGEEIERGLVYPYVATRDSVLVGTAYFDSHRVRTLAETLMIAVSPEGEVMRVEVLAFNEPEEYLPRGGWYEQFLDRPLDDDLAVKQGIRGITGATLTARATTRAVRRVLAVHLAVAGSADP